MTEEKPGTAEEWLRQLNQDPAFRARREEREEAIRQRRRFREHAEKPLVEALREVDLEVDSVWDLVGTKDPYPRAIPILLEHLNGEYPAKIREGIGRALAVRVLSPEDWQVIRRCFVEEPDTEAKWALALVLKTNAREEHVGALEELLADPRSGKGRAALAEGYYRLRGGAAKRVLETLVSDPEIGESVGQLLKTGSIRFD